MLAFEYTKVKGLTIYIPLLFTNERYLRKGECKAGNGAAQQPSEQPPPGRRRHHLKSSPYTVNGNKYKITNMTTL